MLMPFSLAAKIVKLEDALTDTKVCATAFNHGFRRN